MKNGFIYLTVIFVIIFLFSDAFGKKTEIWKFAEFLYQNEEYEKAELEYFRYVFNSADSDSIGNAMYKIGLCNQKLGYWTDAIRYFQMTYEKYSNAPYADRSIFQIGRSYAEMDMKDNSRRYFQLLCKRYPESDLCDDADFMIGLSYLGEYKWKKGSLIFDTFSEKHKNSNLSLIATQMKEKTLKGTTLSLKSPVLGGFFSTIIPGSGQVYGTKYWDGLMAFIVNGALAYGTITSWKDDCKTTSYVLGFLNVSFYLGNIYGGYNAPKRYNMEKQKRYLQLIRNDVLKELNEMD